MKLHRSNLSLALLALSSFCSCAAIIDGNHDEVTIQSDPPGQTIHIADKFYRTPVTVELITDTHHTVVGPRGETYPIHSRPNRLAVIESLLIFPILPDFIVGAYTTLEPSVINLSSETAPLVEPGVAD